MYPVEVPALCRASCTEGQIKSLLVETSPRQYPPSIGIYASSACCCCGVQTSKLKLQQKAEITLEVDMGDHRENRPVAIEVRAGLLQRCVPFAVAGVVYCCLRVLVHPPKILRVHPPTECCSRNHIIHGRDSVVCTACTAIFHDQHSSTTT